MKWLTATVSAAIAILIFVVAPAHALKAIVATIALGEVQVIGIQANKNASIKWEGKVVTKSSKLGAFLFSTTNLPINCVGQLSDGVSTIPVVVFGCTTQQVIGGGVPKTGQTTSAAGGDDGNLKKGVASPDPRFTDNGNGTITDNLTGLIWLKNANCFGTRQWATAISDANTLASGACGLTDGSGAGDWRLPNLRELQSLVDYGTITCCITIVPALPSGHPFTNFQASFYWSSTTHFFDSNFAWGVGFSDGFLENLPKAVDFEFDTLVLAVRGGS